MTSGIVRGLLCCAAVLVVGWLLGPWPALLAAALCVPALVRTQDGKLWWAAIVARWRFRWADFRGHTRHAGLPGVLGDASLSSKDGAGVIGADGTETLVYDAEDLADHVWLELLADDDDLVAVSVTSQCGSAVYPPLRPAKSVPEVARRNLLEAAPRASQLPDTWVALTWRRGHAPADLEQATGPALSPTGVAGLVGLAFDPRREPPENWSDVGPESGREWRSRYEHDGCTSLVWSVVSGPANPEPLQAEQPDVPVKRTTRMYRLTTAGVEENVVITATCLSTDDLAVSRVAGAVRDAARRANAVLTPAGVASMDAFVAGLGVGAGNRGLAS